MKTYFALGVVVAVGVGTASSRGGLLLVVTTDGNLNDHGGADEFNPIPDDGLPHRIYVWAASTPIAETVFEFNLDLAASGSALSFQDATIGPLFEGVDQSLPDTSLNDLQIGWTAFFSTPPVVPECPKYTLLATLNVSIAPGTESGPNTTARLTGRDFRILSSAGTGANRITTVGSGRNLRAANAVPLCADVASICGDGVADPGEECDDGNRSSGDGCDELCALEVLSNDDCADAVGVSAGPMRFYTNQATTDGPSHPGACQFDGQTYNDIWYDYVADCTGPLTVSLCGSAYDTDLVVYEGCHCPVSGDRLSACNDDGCPGRAPGSFHSRVTVDVVEGQCYKLRIGGWNSGDAGQGRAFIHCGSCESDSDCVDNAFCNGAEECMSGVCQAGAAPCGGQFCDEATAACIPYAVGDVDSDADVDWDDLTSVVRCMGGPGVSLPDCDATDFNLDGATDLIDLALLQANFSGPRP